MAIKERKVTILLALMVLAYGIYAYYYLPKQENPDTSSPTAQIITPFPGATADEVERLVTMKIEEALSGMEGLEYMTSYSSPNVSVVLITLNYEVDYDEQWRLLKDTLETLSADLPTGVMPSKIDTDFTTSAGVILSLSSESRSLQAIETYAQTFVQALSRVEGVKRVQIDGLPNREVEVRLDGYKMTQLPFSNVEVVNMITAQNVSIPAGDIVLRNGKKTVASPRGFTSLDALERLPFFTNPATGEVTRLKDFAKVGIKDTASHSYFVNDVPAILISVYFKSNQNIVLVGDEVRDVMQSVSKSMPRDLDVGELLFQPQEVEDAIGKFMLSLIQGMAFVIVVVLIGMGLRNAIVVSTAIPLSIAITFVMMSLLGIDLQQMSIAALIIALGILVDNSIVISDAIQFKLDESVGIWEASFEGARESAIPVLTSTLTTVAAFAPLMALPGEAGEFAKSLPQVVIIALIASYVVAMFVTPALASLFFRAKRIKRHAPKSKMRQFFIWMLKRVLSMRKTAYLVLVLVIAASAYSVLFLEIALFPYADKDVVYIDLFVDQVGDLSQTEAFVKEALEVIRSYEGIDAVYQSIGGSFPKFYLTVASRPPQEDYAQLLMRVNLSENKAFDDLEKLALDMQVRLDEALDGGRVSVNLLEINQPGPAIDVKISGQERGAIEAAARDIENFLLEDARTIKVSSDQPEKIDQVSVQLKEGVALQYGLTLYDIQNQLNIALSGRTATTMYLEGADYDVVVVNQIQNEQQLLDLKLTGMEAVYLKDLARLEEEAAFGKLKRHNRLPAVFVSADVKPGASATVLQKDLESYIESTLNLEGVEVDFGGDKEIIDKYISGLIGAAIFALIVIYIILLIQFNSLVQPLVVLMSVPLSVIGSVLILLAFGMNITFTVGLGVASLIGIVVNNAILLIEFMNRRRLEEPDLKSVCIQAVDRRFKPIFLSTITTIIGLVPLALSRSSFFTPMALALMGGLMVSTLLTLIVIPLIYYSVEMNRKAF